MRKLPVASPDDVIRALTGKVSSTRRNEERAVMWLSTALTHMVGTKS